MITLLATTRLAAWTLLICLPALLGTHFTTARLDRSSYVPLVVRVLMFPTVFFLASPTAFGIDWIFDTRTIQMLGQIAAIELCLQHWKFVPSPASGRFPASSLLLSSLVYLAGANIYAFGGPHILYITPLFVLLMLWALLDWKPGPLAGRSRPVMLACWTLAIASGWGLHTASMVFKNELMGLGSQLFREGLASELAGVSNQPHLGSRFDIPDSPRRVLRVQGELSDPHLRAASFDLYQDGSWGPAFSERRGIDANFAEPGLRAPAKNAPARLTRARITRLAEMPDSPVFAPLNMVGLRALESADIDGPTYDFEPGSGLLRCSEPNPFAYEVTESARSIQGTPSFQGPLCPRALSPTERAKYLQLPAGFDPRVTQIARQATRGDASPLARVNSLARYLLANHHYSRSIHIERGRGPISQFIVDRQDAHCEFFASALALMCRGVGVPARYVIGYLAHEAALGEPNVLNVRQRDAHAWTEVWIDGVGWLSADATPGDGRPEARGEVAPTQKWGEWAADFLTTIRNRAAKTPRSAWAWIVGVPLGLWLLIRGRPQPRLRSHRDSRGYAAPQGQAAQEIEALARDFEKWMAAQKLAPPPSRSWNWFLQREQKDKAARWADEYERARFGHPDAGTLARLQAELSELKS